METPQVFHCNDLTRAYDHVRSQQLSVTDEVSPALQSVGIATKLVTSKFPNLKVTEPADITLAEALVR